MEILIVFSLGLAGLATVVLIYFCITFIHRVQNWSELVIELIKAIETEGAEGDGVGPVVWPYYKKACRFVGRPVEPEKCGHCEKSEIDTPVKYFGFQNCAAYCQDCCGRIDYKWDEGKVIA